MSGGPAENGRAPSTESRFLSSSLAAYGSQIGRTVLRLATDFTLARLVLDVDHGLWDLAISAVLIVGVVRDLGLPYQLVRDERAPYGTVFVWTSGAGVLLTVALIAASPLFAVLDPRLPAVLAGAAPLVLLEGLSVVPRVWFERHLRVGRLVVPELLRGGVLALVAIGLAALGWEVWAFVLGEIAGMAVYAGMLWWRAWGPVVRGGELKADLSILADLIHQSRFLTVIALCAFALPHVERYVLAPFIETAMLAQFNKARYFGRNVQVLLVPAVQRVLYPTLVELARFPQRVFGAFRVGTVTILGFEALAAWFLFFNAETVILRVFFGEQWGPAVPLLRILAFLPLVNPFSRLGGEVLKARSEDRLWLVIVVLDFASLLGFGVWLAGRYGAAGMAVAEFLLLGNLLMTWRIARVFGRDFWRLAADLAYVYLVPAVPFLLTAALYPEEGWGRFALSIVAGLVGVGLLALRFRGPFQRFFAGGEEGDEEEAHG